MSIESLEEEIKEIEAKLKPLVDLLTLRRQQLEREESKLFIKLQKITKDDVQSCHDEGVPYMGHIDTFGKWLADYSDKPWCSWNGRLYRTSDIIAGKMEIKPIGRYEDLN